MKRNSQNLVKRFGQIYQNALIIFKTDLTRKRSKNVSNLISEIEGWKVNGGLKDICNKIANGICKYILDRSFEIHKATPSPEESNSTYSKGIMALSETYMNHVSNIFNL